MSNYKRKKRRQRKIGWTSDGRLHSRNRDAQTQLLTKTKYKRAKLKKITILAKRKPNAPKWFSDEDGWFVWKRYEKQKDADNALKALRIRQGYYHSYYDFKIGV